MLSEGREFGAETPSCMLTHHGARTPGYPQAEGSGPEAHFMMEGRYPLPVSCLTLGLGGCLVVDGEAKVWEGKNDGYLVSPGRDPEPTKKLLLAVQKLKTVPNPL